MIESERFERNAPGLSRRLKRCKWRGPGDLAQPANGTLITSSTVGVAWRTSATLRLMSTVSSL